MLELRVKQGRRNVPIFDLAAALGREEAYRELGDTIDGLIAFLDDLGGDPDLEDATDAEDDFALSSMGQRYAVGRKGAGCIISDPDAEEDAGGPGSGYDISWTEWHTRGNRKDRPGVIGKSGWPVDEDCEDDDQDQCMAADDDPARRISDGLPGDSYDTEHNGDEGDYSDHPMMPYC